MILSAPVSVAVPTSVAAGAGTAVGNLDRKTVTLEGAATATYQLQITLDPTLAAGWLNEGTAVTNPTSPGAAVEVTKPCAGVRWNVTAYTSGTPTSRVSGVQRSDQ